MKLTAWDRFTATLAPKWTVKRLQARAAFETLARHYEAAQPGRRTDGWRRSFADADVNIRGALIEARVHARDLIRNNSWARNGQRVIAANTVGTGILPRALGPEAQTAMQLWRRWAGTTECESEGRHTFYGLQSLAMKSIMESGEVLFRRRGRLPKDKLTLPLQIQVLEADYLDHSQNFLVGQSGGPVIQGIEFDKLGRRTAYWLFDTHPGSGRGITPSKRYDAADVIHVYYTERPGQSRGISWLVTAVLNLKELDQFEDAALVRQKIAACFAAFVTDIDGAIPIGDNSDATQPGVEAFEPGHISYLPPGKDVKFGNPPLTTDEAFTVRNLRKIAAGIGVTYEDLTGDYSNVNFSSGRMGRISHWQKVEDWRWNMLVPLMCDGIWKWAMESAVLAGELNDVPAVEWTPQPMPMLEPDKEGLAISRMVRNGFKTLSEAMREQGLDPDTQFAALAADNARLDALGLVLDSDPRKTTQMGQEQIAPPDGSPAPSKN